MSNKKLAHKYTVARLTSRGFFDLSLCPATYGSLTVAIEDAMKLATRHKEEFVVLQAVRSVRLQETPVVVTTIEV